jgi:uncharacterized protein (TIGR03067 family)
MAPTLLLLTLALAPADAPAPPPDAAVSDAGELQGEWEMVALVISGRDKTHNYKDTRWVFTGSSVRATDGIGLDLLAHPLTVRVDTSFDPPHIEMASETGARSLGIYRRAGDELLWAYYLSGERRPFTFEPAPGVYLWTLRRVKK